MANTKISIKGKYPKFYYRNSFKETFHTMESDAYSEERCLSILQENEILREGHQFFTELFQYRENNSQSPSSEKYFNFIGPFSMEAVQHTMFQFNLEYQDVVIKLELEKFIFFNQQTMPEDSYNKIHLKIVKTISLILKTKFFNERPLFLDLTNGELDFIVLHISHFILKQYFVRVDAVDLIVIGNVANNLSSEVQQAIYHEQLSVKEILKFAISSGVVWWSDEQIQGRYQEYPLEVIAHLKKELLQQQQKDLAIDDFSRFQKEILDCKAQTKILYFLDDNGELVWHLMLISRMLSSNEYLEVTVVVNEKPIANNVNITSVQLTIRDNHLLHGLMANQRFKIEIENNGLPSLDLRFCSPSLKANLKDHQFAIVNGVSYFEKIQFLPIPVYYLFTVYSNVSMMLTGLQKMDGVFAGIPADCFAFGEVVEEPELVIKATLSEVKESLDAAHNGY